MLQMQNRVNRILTYSLSPLIVHLQMAFWKGHLDRQSDWAELQQILLRVLRLLFNWGNVHEKPREASHRREALCVPLLSPVVCAKASSHRAPDPLSSSTKQSVELISSQVYVVMVHRRPTLTP